MSKYTIHIGNDIYDSVTIGDSCFNITSDNADDLANQALVNIKSATVSYAKKGSVRTVQMTFTPILDDQVLKAVDAGDTIIRLQLLYHQPTGKHKKLRKNPGISIIPTTGYDHFCICRFFRIRSHQPSMNGITWMNLTSAQLRAGSANLLINNAITGLNPGGPKYATNYRCSYFDDNRLIFVSAELYVPALGPGHSHPFEYEEKGLRKVASNCVSFTV